MRLDAHLAPRPANHVPLTPLDLLERTIEAHPERHAVVWRDRSLTYRAFGRMVARFASFLLDRGVGPGDVVSVIAPNRPEMLAAHYAVPMIGAVLNTINTRLETETVSYILDHAEARLLIADPAFIDTARTAASAAGVPLVDLSAGDGAAASDGLDLFAEDVQVAVDYRAFVRDEWQPICLNYTSGTTGRPKGVVYHHRGAYLNALGNVLALGLDRHSVYLWTLPMFHCNGWCFPWTVTAQAGVHVCLRAVRGPDMWRLMAEEGVTHMCGAPIVMATLLNTPEAEKRPLAKQVKFIVAGAPPPEAVLAAMRAAGFAVCHVYGLTECYGPSVVNEWHGEWNAKPAPEQAALMARQGVRYLALEGLDVLDPATLQPVPADGATLGEVMMRGNVVMKGYLKDPGATDAAFRGGWFHTGDLAVKYPDGYIQLKDRSKDIIISGGENISSIEVEDALYKHPAVAVVAVVAKPDEKWGETPCAFVELKPGAAATAEELITFARQHLAHFKVPRQIVFAELPKTSTGKIQKHVLRVQAKEA